MIDSLPSNFLINPSLPLTSAFHLPTHVKRSVEAKSFILMLTIISPKLPELWPQNVIPEVALLVVVGSKLFLNIMVAAGEMVYAELGLGTPQSPHLGPRLGHLGPAEGTSRSTRKEAVSPSAKIFLFFIFLKSFTSMVFPTQDESPMLGSL